MIKAIDGTSNTDLKIFSGDIGYINELETLGMERKY